MLDDMTVKGGVYIRWPQLKTDKMDSDYMKTSKNVTLIFLLVMIQVVIVFTNFMIIHILIRHDLYSKFTVKISTCMQLYRSIDSSFLMPSTEVTWLLFSLADTSEAVVKRCMMNIVIRRTHTRTHAHERWYFRRGFPRICHVLLHLSYSWAIHLCRWKHRRLLQCWPPMLRARVPPSSSYGHSRATAYV